MKSLRQVLGRQPYRFPRNPNRKAIQKKQESGSEAKPDSANPRTGIPFFIHIGFSISHPPFPRNVPTGSFLTYRKWRSPVRVGKGSVFCRLHRKRGRVPTAFLQDCFSFYSKCATIRPSNPSI